MLFGGSKFIGMLRLSLGGRGAKIVAAAVAAGLAQVAVVAIINQAAKSFSSGQHSPRDFILFVLCLLGFIYARRYSMTNTMISVGDMLYGSRLRIADKLRRADLRGFEQMDRPEVYKTLVENTDVIFEAARYLSITCSSVVMLAGACVYLAVLSLPALVMCVVMIAAAVAVYQANMLRINLTMRESRDKESEFLHHLNDLIDGFKEVKVSSQRSKDLFENYISDRSVLAKGLKIKSEDLNIRNFVFSETFFMILLGACLFLLPMFSSSGSSDVASVIYVVLFTMGPLGQVVALIPSIYKAEFAVAALEELESRLDALDDTKRTAPHDPFSTGPFRRIELQGLLFNYGEDNGQRGFTLGPLDLTINAGEILFVVGGNGSGKSTLLKLLTGLYYPLTGRLLLDGQEVNQANYAYFRDLFTVIFGDFHLFDRLYGLGPVDPALVAELLETMQLGNKTAFQEGRFTNLGLSSGQRKRLALICSYLDDKQIFVLDEVAADLDPAFRVYFYQEFLPRLKALGKTIIAVSHDDRFFHLADRVVKLEYGEMVPWSGRS